MRSATGPDRSDRPRRTHGRRLGRRLFAWLTSSVRPRMNNGAMVVLALILLVLVAVLVIAIVVSNPEVYDLSIFGAVVPANAAGIFITGAVAMAVTILALLLLRTGIRRGRARRTERKVLMQAAGDKLPGSRANPEETSTTTSKTSDTSATSDSDTTEPTTTTAALNRPPPLAARNRPPPARRSRVSSRKASPRRRRPSGGRCWMRRMRWPRTSLRNSVPRDLRTRLNPSWTHSVRCHLGSVFLRTRGTTHPTLNGRCSGVRPATADGKPTATARRRRRRYC